MKGGGRGLVGAGVDGGIGERGVEAGVRRSVSCWDGVGDVRG